MTQIEKPVFGSIMTEKFEKIVDIMFVTAGY